MNAGGSTPVSLVAPGADVKFYAQRAVQYGGPVLLLGCAQGRVAWELCERGISTVAVDPSALMVKAAEERRAEEPMEVSERLRLLFADLRSLRLDERFPLVLAAQNAAGLMASLDDLEALFATARHHLAPSGTFIFDVLNAGAGWRARTAEGDPRDPVTHNDPPRAVFLPHLRENRRSPDGGAHQGIRRLKLRPFHPEEVDAGLTRAGMTTLERFGSFEEKPFDIDDPIQVVVCSRE